MAWRPALDPRLLAAILLHDNPWRSNDATPKVDESGNTIDFIGYPNEARIALYSRGLDALTHVDPYTGYLVSLHYSTFTGMDPDFVAREEARRAELAPLLSHRLDRMDQDLSWLKFFDIASLWLCLTGPDVDDESLPQWLVEPYAFAHPPDAIKRTWTWTDTDRATITPWPFAEAQFTIDIAQTVEDERRVRQVVLYDSAQSTTS